MWVGCICFLVALVSGAPSKSALFEATDGHGRAGSGVMPGQDFYTRAMEEHRVGRAAENGNDKVAYWKFSHAFFEEAAKQEHIGAKIYVERFTLENQVRTSGKAGGLKEPLKAVAHAGRLKLNCLSCS